MCKAFLLKEEVEGAVGTAVPAAVRFVAEKVKESEKGTEFVVCLEDVATGVAGDRIEHVFDVKEEESTGGGGGVSKVVLKLGESEMDDKVHAARDINAVLACWGEELDDGRGHDGDAEFGCNAAKGCAHADGSEFG